LLKQLLSSSQLHLQPRCVAQQQSFSISSNIEYGGFFNTEKKKNE
jgi:hypothetical protein